MEDFEIKSEDQRKARKKILKQKEWRSPQQRRKRTRQIKYENEESGSSLTTAGDKTNFQPRFKRNNLMQSVSLHDS